MPVREHLKRLEKQSGRRVDELHPDPPPPVASHVWAWFVDLSNTRASGLGGPSPVAYSEILAWSQMSDISPEPWELRALRLLDTEYIGHYASREEDAPGD